MPQNTTSTASARIASFFNNPLSQAVAAGALAVIPARTYPTWLRRGMIWTPAIVGVAGSAYLVTNSKAVSKFAKPQKNTGRADRDYLPTVQLSSTQRASRGTAMVAVGGGIGAVISLTTAAGFWVDEKIERGLRRLNVPFPRAVMGVGTGALIWLQEKQDKRQNS